MPPPPPPPPPVARWLQGAAERAVRADRVLVCHRGARAATAQLGGAGGLLGTLGAPPSGARGQQLALLSSPMSHPLCQVRSDRDDRPVWADGSIIAATGDTAGTCSTTTKATGRHTQLPVAVGSLTLIANPLTPTTLSTTAGGPDAT
jgi:hypothetical protein